MTPGENCYILGYIGPNEISEDVPEMARSLISMVHVSDFKDEPVTCGSPYNFVVLNNPVIGHLGKWIRDM